jgi:hypothetical protein
VSQTLCEFKGCPHYGKESCNPGVNCTKVVKWDSTSTHPMCGNCGQTKKVCNCLSNK